MTRTMYGNKIATPKDSIPALIVFLTLVGLCVFGYLYRESVLDSACDLRKCPDEMFTIYHARTCWCAKVAQ